MRTLRPVLVALPLVVLLGCSGSSAGSRDAADEPTADLAGATTPLRVVAVGDIACPPGGVRTRTTCRQADTARLTQGREPAYVLSLGDQQYENGSYYQFTHSYDRSWGSLKAFTRPVPGNHEYRTPGAAGYFRYFGRTSPGWFAWNAGTWRIYNLNSNCDQVDCARELTWLADDLDAHPRACTIIASHHPRFSSGLEHGNTSAMLPFWRVAYRHRVDVAVAGHDHDYERFVRLSPGGVRDPERGITSYVSGAGGKSLYRLGVRKAGSVYFNGSRFGVLTLDLGDGRWTWEYRTVDGVVRDSGSRTCL